MTRSAHDKVSAYGTNQQTQMDGREIDKRALLNCASRLRVALEDGGKDMKLYQDAIRHNQHLWTIFQVALTDPSNLLEQDLKWTLLRLSAYIDRISFRAITEFSAQILNELIDMNRKLAAGLAKQPPRNEQNAPSMQGAPMPLVGTPAVIVTSA